MPKGITPKNPVITEMKRKYLEGIYMGMGKLAAARFAGSSSPSSYVGIMNDDPWIQGEIEIYREKQREDMEMSREKVQAIVLDAIDMAKLTADPTAMIRGAQELNKMCGYYAPEKKEVTVEGSLRRIQTEFEHMSEVELLEAIGQEQDAIEGEFELLEEEEQDG